VSELIFALDTTGEHGSLALARITGSCEAELLEETPVHSMDGFSGVLFGEIERLLARHGAGAEDIACFAATSGPGSFTGVRVGLACIKGLAEAAGKPVVGVSTLDALLTFGTRHPRAAVLDARRGEAYCSFEGIETVADLPRWLQSLPPGALEIVSTDFTPFGAALQDSRFTLTRAPRELAGAVAGIAARRRLAGGALDPAAIDANYVRRSDAEMKWKESPR
jgi:tRNA threonylcarbamoyladenosine biosynthesis protein TsaB